MIDSLIKLGQELLAEEEKQLGDKKEALIRLLVDKSLLFKQQAEQTRGGKDKKTKKPRELTLARIILDPKTKSAKIDDKWRRQITQSTLQEYRYVFEYMHMTRGRPRLTFKDVKSLNPEADRDEPKSGIDGLLQRIDELERMGRVSDSMKELRSLLTPFYGKNFDVKNGEADLFTVVVDDGKSLIELAKTKGYRDFLYADIRLEHQLASGVCSACQEKTDVVPDPDFPRGSLLKMYITDQPGFISNIPSDNAKKTKALLKNFPLCPNCLTHLLIGHQFIITTSSLSSSIYENKLKAFVIPYSRIRAKRIKEWLSLYEARWVFEAVTKIERDLEEWDEQNYYITIIFGSGERANFRFYGAIREVPLTRLSLYEREIRQLKSELANCLALEQIESFPKLDMGSLGNLIPLRTAVNRVV
ncbi:MAG: TM1802 family CRISPR-associated protein, partial [Candidatus Caldarchaeum sp.]|nr:TM1802 family CRISPR-associated protein [Candidatus Caldarchaeum sp.]MDW8436054.1 TM1802 family CRISPR-associated protein [Candidatus Caldarchaeum sp.]